MLWIGCVFATHELYWSGTERMKKALCGDLVFPSTSHQINVSIPVFLLWRNRCDGVSHTDVFFMRRRRIAISDVLLIFVYLFVFENQVGTCILASGSVKLEGGDSLFSPEDGVH